MSAEHFLPVADQKNNIIRLSAAQALAGANSVVFYATGAIVGNAIAQTAHWPRCPSPCLCWGWQPVFCR
ncbi:hypothetical protein STN0717ENT53_20300 [Enterobacter kobei]|nr:hypothetical protein STN0717ENT53_20300 [Enterobacter kobei]